MKAESRGLFLVVGVLILLGVLGGIYGPSVRATAPSLEDSQSSVQSFARVLDVVEANYADPVDVDKAIYQGAVPGMLRMLDPHSSFFNAEQWRLSQEDRHGKYYGVGMSMMPRGDRTFITYPYMGTP